MVAPAGRGGERPPSADIRGYARLGRQPDVYHGTAERLPQLVCVPCGYNMIGEMPEVCPFCGARHDRFVSWDVSEETYRVAETRTDAS